MVLGSPPPSEPKELYEFELGEAEEDFDSKPSQAHSITPAPLSQSDFSSLTYDGESISLVSFKYSLLFWIPSFAVYYKLVSTVFLYGSLTNQDVWLLSWFISMNKTRGKERDAWLCYKPGKCFTSILHPSPSNLVILKSTHWSEHLLSYLSLPLCGWYQPSHTFNRCIPNQLKKTSPVSCFRNLQKSLNRTCRIHRLYSSFSSTHNSTWSKARYENKPFWIHQTLIVIQLSHLSQFLH